jgi:hypothetical protein
MRERPEVIAGRLYDRLGLLELHERLAEHVDLQLLLTEEGEEFLDGVLLVDHAGSY